MRHAPIRLDNAVYHCTIDHVAPILTDDGLAHDDALAHDHQGFAIGTRGYRAIPFAITGGTRHGLGLGLCYRQGRGEAHERPGASDGLADGT